jgi:integrase
MIKDYRNKNKSKYLFIEKKNNIDKKKTNGNLNKFYIETIKKYYKLINKPYIPFGIHDCRHQHATIKCDELFLDDNFINKLNDIRITMGHSTISTTITHYIKKIKK